MGGLGEMLNESCPAQRDRRSDSTTEAL